MAKGKHATALFEVICTGKNPPKSSSTGGIATPKWWFKGRHKPAAAPALSIAEPEPQPRIIDEPVAFEPPTMRIAGDNPLTLDKASGEIKFKLSYAGVAAAGFILIVILITAYMIGTRTTQIGQTETFQRANNPIAQEPSVTTGALLAAVTPAPEEISRRTHEPDPAPINVVTPTPSPEIGRQVGLNYVVFQSYPDPAVAQRAMDFLVKAGFPCTLEKVPGFPWSSVVSLKGFDHIQRNPELEDYKGKIAALSESFAGKRPFNRFEPVLYKWRPAAQP
jgi:hypothetical protein